MDTFKNSFLTAEKAFFKDADIRAANTSERQKQLWRKETVRERKLRVSQEVYNACRGKIQQGPFKGVQLVDNPWWSQADKGSMMLGGYEPHITQQLIALSQHRDVFIDIGAADGYYAVSLIAKGFYHKSLCFEQSDAGQRTIKDNRALNRIPDSKIEIYGSADHQLFQHLQHVELANAVILIDIEGGEFELLNTTLLQQLQSAVIIIEIHNWVNQFWQEYERLLNSASTYFDISRIDNIPIDPFQYEELNGFTDDNRLLLFSESRPNKMRFLQLTPRS